MWSKPLAATILRGVPYSAGDHQSDVYRALG
jgi:hypothetical protein